MIYWSGIVHYNFLPEKTAAVKSVYEQRLKMLSQNQRHAYY